MLFRSNDEVDRLGREVRGPELRGMFWAEYIHRSTPYQLLGFETEGRDGIVKCRTRLLVGGVEKTFEGQGNGPIAAFVNALIAGGVPKFEVVHYAEHALSAGEAASAIAYIQIRLAEGRTSWGAGVDTSIELASIKAVLSALNRC